MKKAKCRRQHEEVSRQDAKTQRIIEAATKAVIDQGIRERIDETQIGEALKEYRCLLQLRNQAEAIIGNVCQLENDVAHWNEYVRKPHEEPIAWDDPEGRMARSRAAAQEALRQINTKLEALTASSLRASVPLREPPPKNNSAFCTLHSALANEGSPA